jgi:large subunit GTPase 1
MKWRRELAKSVRVALRTGGRLLGCCGEALNSHFAIVVLCSAYDDSMEESTDERQLTPFEKNLEVWKQLWRVLERSQIVVQILDARNPLLFRSKDMEAYVKELSSNKMCLLVINKADYLTPQARRMWAEYFTAHNIDFVFWSAALEQARLDDIDRKRRRREERGNYHGHNIDEVDEGIIKGADSEDEEEDVLYEQDDEEDEDDDKVKTLKASSLWKTAEQGDATASSVEKLSLDQSASSSSSSAAPAAASSSSTPAVPAVAVHQILTRDALFAYIIAKFVNFSPENKAHYEAGERITVGMTGYPNVGQCTHETMQERHLLQRMMSTLSDLFDFERENKIPLN